MGEFFDQIPDKIKEHIKEITKTSGLEDNEESLEKISGGWIEKKNTFEEQIGNAGMEEIDLYMKDDKRAALAITYSGSLINIGPVENDKRKASYASIGLRKDVPDMVTRENSILKNDIKIDEIIEFEAGPVKKSSPIFKIAVCSEDLSVKEQEKTVNEAATVIMDEFIEVNKTIIDQ